MAATMSAMGPDLGASELEIEIDDKSDGSDEYVRKLLAEEGSGGSDHLKELISANGLISAWNEIRNRMQELEAAHAKIWEHASPAALLQTFTMKSEFDLEVKIKLQGNLEGVSSRAAVAEGHHQTLAELVTEHAKAIHEAKNRLTAEENCRATLKQEMDSIEELSCTRHNENLGLLKTEENTRVSGEAVLQNQIDEMQDHLRRLDAQVVATQVGINKQQVFLESDELISHIRTVCSGILRRYVLQSDMAFEASQACENLVGPIVDDLDKLTKQYDASCQSFENKDRHLLSQIQQATEKHNALSEVCDERFAKVHEQIDLCQTIEACDAFEALVHEKFSNETEQRLELQKETIDKIVEMNGRTKEFQIILQDHEHALQHHAEELLNRSTKYDLVVCQQRIDACAIKDKVDKDLKELQSTVEWQSSQLEILGYGKSFGATQNTSVSVASISGSSTALPSTCAPTPITSTCAPSPVTPAPLLNEDDFNEVAPTSSKLCNPAPSETGQISQLSRASVLGGGEAGSPQAPSQVQVYRVDQPSQSAANTVTTVLPQTEAIGLLRMQMEALSQALLSLGQMCAREVGLVGLTKSARKSMESELLEHMNCLMHWISHQRAPLVWDPKRLASLALRCATNSPPDDEPEKIARSRSSLKGVGGEAGGRTSVASRNKEKIDAIKRWSHMPGQLPENGQRPRYNSVRMFGSVMHELQPVPPKIKKPIRHTMTLTTEARGIIAIGVNANDLKTQTRASSRTSSETEPQEQQIYSRMARPSTEVDPGVDLKIESHDSLPCIDQPIEAARPNLDYELAELEELLKNDSK